MQAVGAKRVRVHSTTQQADVFGVLCSLACAIHCAATPLCLAILPSVTTVRVLADPLLHQVAAVVCSLLVLRAIVPGFRAHRSGLVVGSAILGLACLFFAAFVLPDSCCDPSPTDFGPMVSSESNVDGTAAREADWRPSPSGTRPVFRFVSAANMLERPSQELEQPSQVWQAPEEEIAANDAGISSRDDAGFQLRAVASPRPRHPSWGRKLLDQATLSAALDDSAASQLIAWQPLLSPLGGGLLIVAHVLNIFLGRCPNRGATHSGCRSSSVE